MAEAQDGQSVVQEDGLNPAPSSEPSGDLVSETLLFIARALVDHVDDVRVERFESDRGPGYRLLVHADDMGRVIGRQGRMARSIRQLGRAAAARADTTAYIEIGR